MNRNGSPVTQSAFLGYVGEASGGGATDPARQFIETTSHPDTWSGSDHQAAFGPLPPQFRYRLPARGSDGFRVRGPYRDGSVGTTTVVTGETVVFDVTVANEGGLNGTYGLDVTVDGRAVAARSGELAAGATTTETVEYNVSAAGRHRFVAGEDSVGIEVREPASSAVTGLSVSGERVRPGNGVTVTATVGNPADRPARGRVAITREGAEIAGEQVRLAPGQSTTVETSASFSAEGTYQFGAGDRTVSVTVVPEMAGSGGGSADSGESSDGAFGPGFGLPAAVAAILALLLVGHRIE
jgi:hypothetical protein